MTAISSSEALITSLAEYSQSALELAEAVSFAVRIEPFLLRRIRLEVLPGVESGAEADVWLSPLVQVRSPEGVVFHPEVADSLRGRLRSRNPGRFERSWSLVRECHAHLPRDIQLEEEIAYLSADPSVGALQAIDHLLQRTAKTLVSSDARQGITNWAARALPRMPPSVRDLEGARMLASASYLRLARQLLVTDVDSKQPIPPWMAWILPSDLASTHVRVRLLTNAVELSLGEIGDNTIRVPDIKPCLVEISWTEDGRDQVRQVSLQRDDRQVIQAPAHEFQIRTVLGERYRLAEKLPMQEDAKPQATKTCYVVMGFGKKTDYATGRALDLDKTYQLIIKPAAEAAGLNCLRADEIAHSGDINVPMFEWLMNADVVVADLSTYNANAFYKLGVRHAFRPYQTIVIAEDQMVYPFDFSALAVRKYQHLGPSIGYDEVERMRKELTSAFQSVADIPQIDSPVYTLLPSLNPPFWSSSAAQPGGPTAASPEERQYPNVRSLLDKAEEAINRSDFITAKSLLNTVRSLVPTDASVIQKLAEATYKSKFPTPLDALHEARLILAELKPEATADSETLGLWAAIHKRIWDQTHDLVALDVSIDAFEKAFLLKNDYYNGINYAFLLNVRAQQSPPADAVADFVLAQRVRRKVVGICEALLAAGPERSEEYWILATMAEAWFGLGDHGKATEAMSRASSAATESWMTSSTAEQFKRLEDLLANSPLERAGLMSPPAT